MYGSLLDDIISGNNKALARGISLAANNSEAGDALLKILPPSDMPVIGITGPPGAGKSTLTDKMIGEFVLRGERVAVLCIDPSSAFTHGAILGDRIRMSEWHDHPDVFIRSLATRGSLGGLPPHAASVISIVKAAPFDYLLVETVGVGQNEIEIASLADITLVVLVPESGDEIQVMKAGLMEIGDIFVINKSDRPGADHLANDIKAMLHEADQQKTGKKTVVKTIANTRSGVGELINAIEEFLISGI